MSTPTAATSTETTYRLACPRCSGERVVCEVMGVSIFRVGLDPRTGEVKRGTAQVDFRPADVGIDFYVCLDCRYENVVKDQFRKEASWAS